MILDPSTPPPLNPKKAQTPPIIALTQLQVFQTSSECASESSASEEDSFFLFLRSPACARGFLLKYEYSS